MSGHRIALAESDHVPHLPAIEAAAAELFPAADLPAGLRADVTPVEHFAEAQAAGRLWVALDASARPVGFALVQIVDGNAHLAELDVHPAHARRGLGSRLIQHAAAWARSKRLAAVTLTTFSHIPWNAPFYQRVGFRTLSPGEPGPGLAELLRKERAQGLRRRVAMRLELADAPRTAGAPPGEA